MFVQLRVLKHYRLVTDASDMDVTLVGLVSLTPLKLLSVQSYILLGSGTEGINRGIVAVLEKMLSSLLPANLQDLRIHC